VLESDGREGNRGGCVERQAKSGSADIGRGNRQLMKRH
jgi:hypothetical protein